MMPSMPRLRTPARSQISSPNVAKISGDAIRTAAAHSVVVNRISIASIGYDRVRLLLRKVNHRGTETQSNRDTVKYLRRSRFVGAGLRTPPFGALPEGRGSI